MAGMAVGRGSEEANPARLAFAPGRAHHKAAHRQHALAAARAAARRVTRATGPQNLSSPPTCTPVILRPVRLVPEKFLVRPAEPARPNEAVELLSISSTR